MIVYDDLSGVDLTKDGADYGEGFYYPCEKEWLESFSGAVQKINDLNWKVEKMIKNPDLVVLDENCPF